jgi:hypothetical protein
MSDLVEQDSVILTSKTNLSKVKLGFIGKPMRPSACVAILRFAR